MDEDSIFVEVIQRNINNIRVLITGYSQFNACIENLFHNEYEDEFIEAYNKQSKYMNDCARLMTGNKMC